MHVHTEYTGYLVGCAPTRAFDIRNPVCSVFIRVNWLTRISASNKASKTASFDCKSCFLPQSVVSYFVISQLFIGEGKEKRKSDDRLRGSAPPRWWPNENCNRSNKGFCNARCSYRKKNIRTKKFRQYLRVIPQVKMFTLWCVFICWISFSSGNQRRRITTVRGVAWTKTAAVDQLVTSQFEPHPFTVVAYFNKTAQRPRKTERNYAAL